MMVPVAVSVLVGLIGVPAVLLQAGRKFRHFGARGRGLFRGAVIGYAVAASITVLLLMAPPFAWPPASSWARAWLVGGLLLGPALGAAIGGLTSSRRS
jgi:hypothetical protein